MSTSQTTVGNLAVELGLSDEQFRQALAYAQVQANAAAQKMQNSINTVTASSTKAFNAQGLLNIGRAIDDVQYGFRGVVNNIEGIVMGLGYGAGVAGALTIAGVLANTFGDDIERAFTSVIDGRTEMQKLADQTKYAASIFGELEARIVSTQKTLSQLANTDANAGIGGWIRRQAGFDPDDINRQNRARFRDLTENNRNDVRENNLRRDAMNAAEEFLNPGEPKDARTMRAEAARRAMPNEFQRNLTFGRLVDDLAGNKFQGDYGRAREQARELMGQAAQGIKEGFDELNRITRGKLEVERIRVLAENMAKAAEDFERVTGSAAEINRIENDKIEKQTKADNQRFDRSFVAFEKQENLRSRRESLLNSMNRSEIIGAADVFGRNLNAGMKSEELKQLEEINKGIQDLKPITGLG
jgi:hypothetical protein